VSEENLPAPASPAPHKRRQRYSGRNPRRFEDKYKEHGQDAATIAKVIESGKTPAGTHRPIMVAEILQVLTPKPGELAVDCTLGYGGHAQEILPKILPGGKLLGLDQDPVELPKTEARLRELGFGPGVFTAHRSNFAGLPQVLAAHFSSLASAGGEGRGEEADIIEISNPSPSLRLPSPGSASHPLPSDGRGASPRLGGEREKQAAQPGAPASVPASSTPATPAKMPALQFGVDVILADLGVSSMQIDDPARGFSVKLDGPLDMRMNPQRSQPASALLQKIKPAALAEMLEEFSDEPNAATLAPALAGKQFATTLELAAAIRAALPRLGKGESDLTVRRVFQALRIAVNDEFSALDTFLRNLPACLNPGGRVAILTFHSGEDRRVKKSFDANYRNGIYSEISREVGRPSPEEQRSNPRSAPAKLRWAVRAA
jgi:16S rRNA (cytosine1402-N4)-methyltransferase